VRPRGAWPMTLLGASLLLAAGGARLHQGTASPFDHAKHAKLFVTCATCHAGVEVPGLLAMPSASGCATCHDGTVAKRVDWQPRSGPLASNLRFDHRRHADLRRQRSDTTGGCGDCHADRGAPWMQVRGPRAPQCIGCHTPANRDHLSLPDSACASCHVPLARATALPRERIARLPTPASHKAADFLAAAHGRQARPASGAFRVAQSCATCHARDFCVSCHVDAPEVPTIQALEPDTRSLLVPHGLKAPATHAGRDFETKHGALAGRNGASCRTCHTQESCLSCHGADAPAPARALFAAGAGRGEGARTIGRLPASHTPGWRTRHGPVASATMRSCTSCHVRDYCLTCHLPNAARGGSYHPASYLTRHPTDAYSRASSCTDCHNTGEFCQSCHNQSGLSARRTLLGAGGYHDGNRQFFLGHGQAARQSLESCVTCHVERDCLTCHSVVRGRGFNPHGPGFDPERMLRKNPQLCIACHGTAIPRSR
jgi:hypothetical protein